MKTSNRALFLTNYISKISLSEHLEISRSTFDLYLKTGNWKNYQVEKIDKIFEYIMDLIKNKSIQIIKIYFENQKITSELKTVKEWN